MNSKYWIWLSRIENLGSVRIKKLLEKYDCPEKIWNLKEKDLIKVEGIGKETAKEILKEEYRENLDKYVEYMEKRNIKIINYKSRDYPNKLRNIYAMPIVLYVLGNEKILNDFSLGIVGTRMHTKYGDKVTRDFTRRIVKNNIVTVSGMAKGIDSIAHRETIMSKGKTIAVLGCGIDVVYPQENKRLYEDIVFSGGTIVSEYLPGTKPEKGNFPARNRIISGLSDGLLVIEASKRSGTLITVDFALDQGRNVFVVPRKYI